MSGDGGLGTTYRNRSTFMGREVELDYETVGYTPHTYFSCRGVNTSATATDTMTFTETTGGTQIVYRAEFEFRGIAKFVAPLIVKPRLARLADETVAAIGTAVAGRDL